MTLMGTGPLPHGLLTGSWKGSPHPILIELYEQGGRVYPLRTPKCTLFNGVPGLAERYPSYESFARVDKDALDPSTPHEESTNPQSSYPGHRSTDQ